MQGLFVFLLFSYLDMCGAHNSFVMFLFHYLLKVPLRILWLMTFEKDVTVRMYLYTFLCR